MTALSLIWVWPMEKSPYHISSQIQGSQRPRTGGADRGEVGTVRDWSLVSALEFDTHGHQVPPGIKAGSLGLCSLRVNEPHPHPAQSGTLNIWVSLLYTG